MSKIIWIEITHGKTKKQTEKIKKETGNHKKQKIKNVSDVITNDILVPPEYFSGYAKEKWIELSKEFSRRKTITTVDITALEILCVNYGVAMEAYLAMISVGGSFAGYISGRNSQIMGEYNAFQKSMAIVQRLLLEFGMTPASRSRVPEPEIEKEIDDITKMINET